MITADDLQEFSDSDRFGLTLFVSLLLHLVLVLGTSFTIWHKHQQTALPALDIILVNSHSLQQPQQADFLAQANLDGGGNRDRSSRPRSPSLSAQGHAIVTLPQKSPPVSRSAANIPRMLTSSSSATIQSSSIRNNKTRQHKTSIRAAGSQNSEQQEAARFEAELNKLWEAYQKRPRSKYISARTRQYRYAAYMEAWRMKVEQIGNLNYPEEARRRQLAGKLVLDVAINPGGTVRGISILRSSGHQVLDDAALRIVRLAAPFSPFPAKIRKRVDILHIIRTWQFLRDNHLVSR